MWRKLPACDCPALFTLAKINPRLSARALPLSPDIEVLDRSEPSVKIAIVGSGIAGLAACHLLAGRGHEVHLFESQDQLGMSAQTVEFDSQDEGASMVLGDVPSRMFNAGLWPNVVDLYRALGIEVAAVDATQSYRLKQQQSTLQLQLPFRWTREAIRSATSAVSTLVGSRSGQTQGRSDQQTLKDQRSGFLAEMTRLRDDGQRDIAELAPEETFLHYLNRNEYSTSFREKFLYPALSSTVCTCSHAAINRYPAVVLLDAMRHISGDQRLSRVAQGSRAVSQTLTRDAANVCLSTQVDSVRYHEGGVLVVSSEGVTQFDHVVIATQANHVADIVSDLSESEKTVLKDFRYENVDIAVHTDDAFMPSDKREWATFNFVACDEEDESMCTVWMNRFHTNWSESGLTSPVFQTIRPIREIREDQIIRFTKLQRPVVDASSWQRWKLLRELHQQKDRQIWFCGSYAMPGVPLLESGVSSAMEISAAISNA